MAKSKKVLKGVGIALVGAALLGGGVAAGFALDKPDVIQREVPVKVEVPVEVPVENPVNEQLMAELEESQDSIAILEADLAASEKEVIDLREALDDDMKTVNDILKHVYDSKGEVEYLVEDLDDDEINLIVDRIAFINEVRDLAVKEVKKELFKELDDEEFDGVVFDKRDCERLRIDDEPEELEILDVDFDDGDVVIGVSGTFEQDDVKYEFEAEVEFRDGEVDDLDVISVEEVE